MENSFKKDIRGLCSPSFVSLQNLRGFIVKGASLRRSWMEWTMVLGHSPLRCLAADGAILLDERKELLRRKRAGGTGVPRGFVSSPWQPSQCLIKLSPCPPPCSSVSTFLSLQLSPAIPLVHPLVHPTKQPNKDSAKEGTKRLVTSCSLSNNLWDLHAPMCRPPSRTRTPRGSPRNI